MDVTCKMEELYTADNFYNVQYKTAIAINTDKTVTGSVTNASSLTYYIKSMQ